MISYMSDNLSQALVLWYSFLHAVIPRRSTHVPSNAQPCNVDDPRDEGVPDRLISDTPAPRRTHQSVSQVALRTYKSPSLFESCYGGSGSIVRCLDWVCFLQEACQRVLGFVFVLEARRRYCTGHDCVDMHVCWNVLRCCDLNVSRSSLVRSRAWRVVLQLKNKTYVGQSALSSYALLQKRRDTCEAQTEGYRADYALLLCQVRKAYIQRHPRVTQPSTS